MNRILVLGVAALSLALSACGGGGSPSMGNPANSSVGGIWEGNIETASGATVTGLAIATEDGAFFSEADNSADGCADVASGNLSVSGDSITGTVSVAVIPYKAGATCAYSDGSAFGQGTISGTVSQRSSLMLTGTYTTSKGMSLPSNAQTLHYNALYALTSAVGKVAAGWTEPNGLVINIDQDGTLFQRDPVTGCTLSGTVSVVDASYNAYATSGTYANCTGSAAGLNGLKVTGLLALDNTVKPLVLYGGYSGKLSDGTVVIATNGSTNTASPVAAPSKLSYSVAGPFLLGFDVNVVPTYSGFPTTFTISPALPAGVTFDPSTGDIGGIPSQVSPPITYTVMASGDGGITTGTVQLSVQEIAVTAAFTGSTGLVDAVVAPNSVYGIQSVSATLDGVSLGTLTAPNHCSSHLCFAFNEYAFAVNASTVGSGAHTLVVTVTDGNNVTTTLTQQVTFNNPPVITVSPGDGAIVRGSLALSGTVQSDKSGTTLTTAATFDGVNFLNATGTSFSTTYDVSSATPGNHTLAVVSTDGTGTKTTVQESIDVASAPSLVFTPIARIPGTSIVAADQTTFLTVGGSPVSFNLYAPSAGSFTVTPLHITDEGPNNWRVSGGSVFANGEIGNIYEWSSAGVQSQLASGANELIAVHDGWALWGPGANTSYVLYNLTTHQTVIVALPAGESGVTNNEVDFYLNGGNLTLYFDAVSNTAPFTTDVYVWQQSSNTSTRVTNNGANGVVESDEQTDGTYAAWQMDPAVVGCTTAPGTACPKGLEVYTIASSTTQTLSQTLIQYRLSHGLVGWQEGTTISGGIKAWDGTTTSVITAELTAQLLGVGNGYVLYLNNGKLSIWNSTSKTSSVLFDGSATVGNSLISGKTVYFTYGSTQALYQVTLP